MNQPVEPFFQHVGFSRSLGATMLAGFEEVFSFQIDHAQAFATRSSRQMRMALSGAASSKPECLPEALQQWISGTNTLIRDAVVSGIDYQCEMLRLLRKQAAEAHEVIYESIHEQVAAADQTSGRSRRGSKTSGLEKKLAA